MGSGGARTGTPGNVYPLRTDLNTNRTPTTAPAFKGQVYGTGVQQQAVAQAGAQAAQQVQPGIPQGQLVPPGVPAPGQFPHLLSPTDRPNEPVTAGMPFGPGPNSIPQPFQADPMATARAVINTLPAAHMTPQLAALKAALGASANNAASAPSGAPIGVS